MAYESYLHVKGNETTFPGMTPRNIPEMKVTQADHTTVIAIDHGVSKKIHPQGYEPTGEPILEPFRVTIELDKNYPLYYKALLSGEALTVTVLFGEQAQRGQLRDGKAAGNKGGTQLAMTYTLEDAHIVGIALASGNAALGSAHSATDRTHHDLRETVVISFVARKVAVKSASEKGDKMAHYDYLNPTQHA